MTVAASNLQSIANSRAALDERKRAVICRLLTPQIAIDCKCHGRLSNLIREQREENYRPPMHTSYIEYGSFKTRR